MKKIAYVVALGLLSASVQANEGNGQALFSIASDAMPVAQKQAASVAAPQAQREDAPAQSAAPASPAAPLFNVSADAREAVAQNGDGKLVMQKKPSATLKAPAKAAEPAAHADKSGDKAKAASGDKALAKADTAAPPAIAPKTDNGAMTQQAAQSGKADDSATQPQTPAKAEVAAQVQPPAQDGKADASVPEESTLFKVASYYEADEMGESDDAVRKIDFSKPPGQQLPSDAQQTKTALNAEIRGQTERAIASSKAIQRAAPGEPKKQRKGSYSYVVRGKRYQTLASSENFVEEGPASWYGPGFHGRKTASGEIYDMHKLTAAHKGLPLGTKLEVTNKRTGKSVVVTVNDRGPFHGNRILDLSHAAASQLGLVHAGVGEVTIRAIK